jgi:hypothetical protein
MASPGWGEIALLVSGAGFGSWALAIMFVFLTARRSDRRAAVEAEPEMPTAGSPNRRPPTHRRTRCPRISGAVYATAGCRTPPTGTRSTPSRVRKNSERSAKSP